MKLISALLFPMLIGVINRPQFSTPSYLPLETVYHQNPPLSTESDTSYLTAENKLTPKRKNADRVKVVTKTDTGYVVEFLTKELELTRRITYKDAELKVPHGSSVEYFGKNVGSNGAYIEGNQEGLWTYYHWNGEVSARVSYKNGKRISEEYFRPGGEKETDPKKIDQLPSFPGGQSAMGAFYGRVLRYPPNARERGVKGTVKVAFNIMPDGQLQDIIVISGPDEELNSEALRVIKMMPRWIPAIQFNRPVKFAYVLPIFFQLG